MQTWPSPPVPVLPVAGPAVRVHDTSSGTLVDTVPERTAARLYVCGITPYDATHLGHAATYVGFDLLNRAWRNAGHEVEYVQNVTDVDDPLLERATRDGLDWTELAEREVALFREDMAALRVLAPDHYVGVVESIPLVVEEIQRLVDAAATYDLDGDLYYPVSADPAFGDVSRMLREEMLHVFPDRGGDPDRPGKRDPLDALLWRAERPGEPSWDSPFGRGRPGWHIECSAIAMRYLGPGFDVQGGGSDLVFPHHEMSAGHTQAGRPGVAFARAYVHAGMVGYEGSKMSKSQGNLVFVSRLRRTGVDPMAVRLTLLAQHYRSDWEYQPALLDAAQARLSRWRQAVASGRGRPADETAHEVLAALADDLDAPRALAAIDAWVAGALAAPTDSAADGKAADLVVRLVDAALGVRL